MQINRIWHLKRVFLMGVLLITAAGCSSTNLGQIDETDDPRETMPGPGVLADEQGETPLTLKTGSDKEAAKSVVASVPVTDEQTEFEQFKKWDHLRTNEAESAEYQEFLEWMKYQKFKAGQ
jgi:hypothetical protein